MAWRKTLQQRLGVTADGILGPISYAALFRRLGASPAMAEQFGRGAALHLPAYGVDATPARLTEWFGECGHESLSFTRLVENLRYTSIARIRAVWPSRFRSDAAAAPYVANPQGLANHVYANRNGNGGEASGDGWRFRGRGLIQLTGRANYRASADRLGLPLEARPDMVAEPLTAVEVSAEWWRRHGLNERADRGESRQIGAIINTGGPNGTPGGLPDRNQRKAAIRRLWQ